MKAIKRSTSVNKRYSSVNEVSPIRDSETNRRNNQRKRKLSDMLGPQWSKEELRHFYEAYRKYNADWKKVASTVRSRSIEMVEALYTMNRAYLSLPEGIGSVVGLITIMTDYYNNLARDSEEESNDGVGTSRKPQKRARVKSLPSNSKALDVHFMSPPPEAPSCYVFQSLLKERSGGSRPRAVGKRTPRFPVAYLSEQPKKEKLFSANRQAVKSKAAANHNYDVTREIPLALTEASQKGGSPQVSETPSRTESVLSSPIRNAETKIVDSDIDADGLEGSMEADTGELSWSKTYLKKTAHSGTRISERIFYEKKLEVDDTGNNLLDDTGEACCGTEGRRSGSVRHADARVCKPSPQGPRKKSEKVLFKKDEDDHEFDALQTLADISSMMPADANQDDIESMKQIVDGHMDESGLLEAMPAARRRKLLSSKLPKSRKVSFTNVNVVPEMKQELYPSKLKRKKPKIVTFKIQKSVAHPCGQLRETQDAGTRHVGMMTKDKKSQSVSPILTKNAEHSSSAYLRREESDSTQSTMQVPLANQNTSVNRVRSRRKNDLKKLDIIQKDLKFSNEIFNDRSFVPLAIPNDKAFNLKKKLSNCLSNRRLRRWCMYEWFYNAIDYPWFAKREFFEYLYHVGLGHVPRLTRVEWGVIRSSLGKPRRFSQQFLKEEKEKLSEFRDSVRNHYTELREGVREGLPTDLARPLSVGQRVVAVQPRSREIHDGSVLTVDHSRCRVQFDRPDLGVEFVTDIDCMPLNPVENLPTLLARQIDNKFFEKFNDIRVNERAKLPIDNVENINGVSNLSSSTFHLASHSKQIKVAPEDVNLQTRVGVREPATYQSIAYPQLCTAAQAQAKEADVQALAKLKCFLDKKEALVSELKHMNDDVVHNYSYKESESLKSRYATVLVQLHDANEQVSSALICLRQRNTYPETISLACPRPMGDPGSLLNSTDHSICQSHESGFHVNEIIDSSRKKARTMVDVALQGMSSLKSRENTFEKIGAAIDYVNQQLPSDDSTISSAPDPDGKGTAYRKEAYIPSELITQCVATLLMIQKCAERQFPPADVARILDSAVTSLKPSCSRNLPVYTEIHKCMGIVRNQILGLVPT